MTAIVHHFPNSIPQHPPSSYTAKNSRGFTAELNTMVNYLLIMQGPFQKETIQMRLSCRSDEALKRSNFKKMNNNPCTALKRKWALESSNALKQPRSTNASPQNPHKKDVPIHSRENKSSSSSTESDEEGVQELDLNENKKVRYKFQEFEKSFITVNDIDKKDEYFRFMKFVKKLKHDKKIELHKNKIQRTRQIKHERIDKWMLNEGNLY